MIGAAFRFVVQRLVSISSTASPPSSPDTIRCAVFLGVITGWPWRFFTVRYFGVGPPFNADWCGFTFPLGSLMWPPICWPKKHYSCCFSTFGCSFYSHADFVLDARAQRSFVGMWGGYLFRAPCLPVETGLLDRLTRSRLSEILAECCRYYA